MKSILFGIDKQFFQTISKQERNKYNTILVFFLIILLISFLSGFQLSYMIYTNYIFSIFSGCFIAFMIYSFFTFAFSSNERDYSSFTKTTKILNFSFYFEIFFLLVLGVLIAFPFACLVQRQNAVKSVKEQKMILISNFNQKQLEVKNRFLKVYSDEITKLENQINHKKELVKVIKDSISMANENLIDLNLQLKMQLRDINLLKDLKSNQIKFNSKKDSLFIKNSKQEYLSYVSRLDDTELPIYQLTQISTTPTGTFIILAINLLIVILSYVFRSLTFSEKYLLSKNLTEEYRKQIILDYKSSVKECSSILKSKYNYVYNFETRYLDPPFNTMLKSSDETS